MGARIALALVAGLAATLASAAPRPATRLFAEDAPIKVTIRGPISAIASTPANSRAAQPAVIEVGAEKLPIQLSPRGRTRRQKERCTFPPLRVEFPAKPANDSLFERQKRLKLVTHCRTAPQHQQYVLLEYAVYRLFAVINPAGLRARLAAVDYVDTNGKTVASRLGFFIEDADDAASRSGLKEAPVGGRVPSAQLDPAAAARAALFEYMIGNTDWSMRQGPPGDTCCHNFRLLGLENAQTGLIPVPFDFDSAGLVDAPYAAAAEQLGLSSVRERHYRGYCAHNQQAVAASAEFRSKQAQLLAVLDAIPQLDDGRRQGAVKYLQGFFRDIATDEDVRKRVLKSCTS